MSVSFVWMKSRKDGGLYKAVPGCLTDFLGLKIHIWRTSEQVERQRTCVAFIASKPTTMHAQDEGLALPARNAFSHNLDSVPRSQKS
jgi:hypothetical protein